MATYIGKTKQRSSKTKLWGFWLVVWGFFRGGGGVVFSFYFCDRRFNFQIGKNLFISSEFKLYITLSYFI